MSSRLLLETYESAELAKELLEDFCDISLDDSLEELMGDYGSGFNEVQWKIESIHENAVIQTLRWCASSTKEEIIEALLEISN